MPRSFFTRCVAAVLSLPIAQAAAQIDIGAGLRVRTPFVMLRIDYGHPLNGGPDASGRWFFSIGQMF